MTIFVCVFLTVPSLSTLTNTPCFTEHPTRESRVFEIQHPMLLETFLERTPYPTTTRQTRSHSTTSFSLQHHPYRPPMPDSSTALHLALDGSKHVKLAHWPRVSLFLIPLSLRPSHVAQVLVTMIPNFWHPIHKLTCLAVLLLESLLRIASRTSFLLNSFLAVPLIHTDNCVTVLLRESRRWMSWGIS